MAFDPESVDASDATLSLEQQFILAQVGARQLAFPADWVAAVLLVERSQVLSLPFYPSVLMGLVHAQGQMVPLVSLQQLLEDKTGLSKEVFNAIQLNAAAGELAGLGLVVDRILGNRTEAQVVRDATLEPFQPDWLEPALWRPQRWLPLTD